MSAPRPFNLVAELTYRCPLRCVYCSNPLDFAASRERLSADDWGRVFREAAGLGTLHAGLTGGEPTLRADLPEIVRSAAAAGLFVHLVTAGTTCDRAALEHLKGEGLRSVQLSVQDSTAGPADEIAGVAAFDRKLAFAADARALELPLIVNAVLHRENLGRVSKIVALARELGAERLELANTQYHGWALANRDALLPTRDQIEAAGREVESARRDRRNPEILFVLPDYYADRPKPCMGGWAEKNLVVTPDGKVLPCHAAASIAELEFWNANERSLAECWQDAPGMNAFRGESWMQEPCRSCPDRSRDFGGCRCQAYALTGDAAATDPACALAPHHDVVVAARDAAAGSSPPAWRYRGSARAPGADERSGT